MKNLLEQPKLRKPEQKVANAIALPIALVLVILFYILKLLTKFLIKFKKWLFRASVMVFVIYGLYSFFGEVAYAPKADASVPYIDEPKTEHEEIIVYIEKTFGNDAPTAFRLLECENKALNPNAVNVNVSGSKDIGVFQINEYWQKTQSKFLFNWKINIEIAKQLFDENGEQFNLWTCGKKLNI